MQMLMFSSEEPRASHSQSQDSEKDWLTRVATSCLPTLRLLQSIGPSGWYGRTCPASCHRMEGGILAPSSGRWANSGMGSLTGFLTLSVSEFPAVVEGCSLSRIVEIGERPQRYFLSVRALRGILARLPNAAGGQHSMRLRSLLRERLRQHLGPAPISELSRQPAK